MTKIAARHLACLLGAMLLCPAAIAADATETTQTVRAGTLSQLDAATCILITASPALGTASVGIVQDGRASLLFQPVDKQTEAVAIQAETGSAAKVDGKCPGATSRLYRIRMEAQAAVPPESLEAALRLLTAAFVLALLLESAFELLFNWRLFQAFFVGRAWRTPFMFTGSLLIVRQFKLDLMASLFDAYHGVPSVVSTGSWVSSCLTAMIVGGGSVGVNKIMVALGFRSQLSKVEQEQPKLGADEAWVSIEVRATTADGQYRVEMTAVADTTAPETLAILHPPAAGRVRRLLFPSTFRTPPSGGRRVSTGKSYLITVVDRYGIRYDLNGKRMDVGEQPALIRFAQRAVVDIVVIPAGVT